MLSPAGVLLPSLPLLSLLLRVLWLLCARLCPRPATRPLQQPYGRKRTNGRMPREGRHWERGVSSAVMSPARRALPGIVQRAAAPEPGGRAVTSAGGGAGRGRASQRWPRARAGVSGMLRNALPARPAAHPPGADHLLPFSWGWGKGGRVRAGLGWRTRREI